MQKIYTNAYTNIISQQKQLSQVIYSGILEITELQDIILDYKNKTQEQKNHINNTILSKLKKRVNSLDKNFVKSIKLVSFKNDIFIATSKINKDSKLYSYVYKNKTPLHTYNIQNNSAGFSSIYPIFKDKKYLGLIEITFSEQFLTSSLMRDYSILSNIIIKEKYFDKGFLETNNVYQKAHNEGFLHNTKVLKELQRVANKSLKEIKPSKNTSRTIYSQAERKNINSMFLDSDDVIITTIPILNSISYDQLAFVAIISQGHEFRALNDYYKMIKFMVFILIALIVFVVYQQNLKRLILKENFNKIIQKDKQLLEQSKMAQMGEMIANIAHQWRQPLSTISTAASGVKLNHELEMIKKEDIPKSMDIIVSNCKYLSETIDTFQDFIKEKKVKNEELLQKRIDESLKIVSASLKNNHITLVNNIDYEKEVRLKIVGQELSQVLINILNNAKDAFVQNDIKSSRFVKINLLEDVKFVQIIIEDNAGGISEENLAKVFDPYFTTKHKFKGTGLGLYMCKTIIEKHFEGELSVENGKEGAVFKISLPKNLS
ncbi:sensor histidine kinase [Arcobacter roscoffensis]|uniref:histidine kinase n=1 Tax=Arcobacter roscoffensis TaxID=2961520 RepID=A0ABY5E208_9BACT|nr:HAMP domain-containing sensor histidine kinase [Arcobacter roscoffensis]UTJ05517.1 HAMP domain-containing histidine kinase [Arcobacter roscoffensis]